MPSTPVKWSAALLLLLLVGTSTCSSDELSAATTPSPERSPWVLVADPEKYERITELVPYTINLTLIYNATSKPQYATAETLYVVKVSMSNTLTVKLDTDRIEFTLEDVVDGNNKTLVVTGQVIGYVDLNFEMDVLPKNGSESVEKVTVLSGYLITVIRASDTLDNIFTV